MRNKININDRLSILSETQKAYLAGIVDGEGCISFCKIGSFLYLGVSVANTNKPLINWLRTNLGGTA